MLYVVPTPIGNLSDFTFRAVEVLSSADLILAEDTRVSRRLLKHYEIDKPIQSYHDHNEHKILPSLIKNLKLGKTLALISDAGTPGISDPGFLLIRACIQENIPVDCLPGATAFVPALVVSGLAPHHFYFEGFLPHKKGRKTRLAYLAQLPDSFVLYESPHRLKRCLEELMAVCGPDRQACVCRELSKIHEEKIRGSLFQLIQWASGKEKIKGEIVVIVAGNKEK